MTESFVVLQRKMKELESDFKKFLSLPSDRQTSYYNQHSQDIEQRILFLKNLLSAESSSIPEKPRHLRHVDHRLTELEGLFREWEPNNDLSTMKHFQLDQQSNVNNNVSACCCNESCLNDSDNDGDDDDGLKGRFMEGSIRDNPLFEGSNVMIESDQKDVKKRILEDRVEEKRRLCIVGKYSWIVLGVTLMGFAAIVKFSSCQRASFPIPT